MVSSERNFLVWLKKTKPTNDGIFEMLGVVLWSDASDGKAVIWCEDQGDLAYVKGDDSVLQAGDFFDAGDLVQFDMEMSHSMRLASNPRLVIEKAGKNLPAALLQGANEKLQPPRAANVVRFSPRSDVTAVAS